MASPGPVEARYRTYPREPAVQRIGAAVALTPVVALMVRSRLSIAAWVMAVLLAGLPTVAARRRDSLTPASSDHGDPRSRGVVRSTIKCFGSGGQASNSVGISVPGTSPRRSITTQRARLHGQFRQGQSGLAVTLTESGGRETVAALGGFQEAVITSQASEGELELSYGVGTVAAYLIEMHLSRD